MKGTDLRHRELHKFFASVRLLPLGWLNEGRLVSWAHSMCGRQELQTNGDSETSRT
jgi:hypothetical protein